MAVRLSAAEARRLLRTRKGATVNASTAAAGLADHTGSESTDGGSTAAGGTLEIPGAVAACWFELPFAMRSKSNFRRYSDAARGDWDVLQRFERDVRRVAARFQPAAWLLGDPPPAPVATRPQVLCFMWARTVIDAGNLSKSVIDALEGLYFHTDSSVRSDHSIVTRSRTDQRGFVALAQLPPGSAMRDTLTAAVELAERSCAAAGPAGPLGDDS